MGKPKFLAIVPQPPPLLCPTSKSSTWTRPPSPAARRCNCVRVPADARAASWTIDPARRRPSSIRSSELLQIASIFVHGDLQQQEKLHGRRPRASFILPPRLPPSTGPGARRPGPWSPLPKSSSRAPRLRPLWLVGLAAAAERTCSKPAAAKPAALPPSPICCCAREFDAGALHVHGHAAATSSFLCFPPPSLRTLPLSVFRSIRRAPWRKTGAPSSPASTVLAAVYALTRHLQLTRSERADAQPPASATATNPVEPSQPRQWPSASCFPMYR